MTDVSTNATQTRARDRVPDLDRIDRIAPLAQEVEHSTLDNGMTTAHVVVLDLSRSKKHRVVLFGVERGT
jgi:hypothetical protein